MRRILLLFFCILSWSSTLQAQKALIFKSTSFEATPVQDCMTEFEKCKDSIRKGKPLNENIIEFPNVYPWPRTEEQSIEQFLSKNIKGKKWIFKKAQLIVLDFTVSNEGEFSLDNISGVKDDEFNTNLISKLKQIEWSPGECKGRRWTYNCQMIFTVELFKK